MQYTILFFDHSLIRHFEDRNSFGMRGAVARVTGAAVGPSRTRQYQTDGFPVEY
jgi:hypothetical protein